ncbi:precorrin-3B C(17)-methyltransferase [Kutzneria sp. NPDC051319]|uniref:SecDF P1 head subdomain-containing protein n=1 Tax=Kutzneria sp. NPDC051319 TaxID=3155047 RepID=UPI003426A1C3
MRARVLCLVLALAALGGCQSTSASGSGSTPTPGPDTPHQTLRFRPVLMDPANGEPHIAPSTSNPAPITDPTKAAHVRQAAQLADDPGAQEAAFAALDCSKPDPLKGKDDPALPLAACDTGNQELLLGPVLLDGKAVDKASYLHDADQNAWVINLTFTPSGRKLWADFTGAHEGDYVAMLVDGQVLSSPKINGRIDGDTQISGGFTEQSARDLAASINNH